MSCLRIAKISICWKSIKFPKVKHFFESYLKIEIKRVIVSCKLYSSIKTILKIKKNDLNAPNIFNLLSSITDHVNDQTDHS